MAIISTKSETLQQTATTKSTHDHKRRVKWELKEAGATGFGMMKFAIRYLPQVIHHNEHINGVVYGRYKVSDGTKWLDEGVLVATNYRVIFLDYKPGYSSLEELTYDVISGIKRTANLWFSGLTLHTRIGEYSLRYVNNKCADKFVAYIEKRRLESEEFVTGTHQSFPSNHTKNLSEPSAPPIVPDAAPNIDDEAFTFLQSHDTGVLSTIDRSGDVHGAAVHYIMGTDGNMFILSKSESGKVHNIYANHGVAMTVFDKAAMQTVQLEGQAGITSERRTKDWVWRTATTPRLYGESQHLPPVTQLRDGAFTVIRIVPNVARFTDYKS